MSLDLTFKSYRLNFKLFIGNSKCGLLLCLTAATCFENFVEDDLKEYHGKGHSSTLSDIFSSGLLLGKYADSD